MAIHPSLFTSSKPATVAPASVSITHIQLRDLVLCPREPGIVAYVHERGIVEHDIYSPSLPPRILASPDFHPNTLAALPIPDTNDILYAAGGQDADLHFSYHAVFSSNSQSSLPSAASPSPSSNSRRTRRSRPSPVSKLIWQFSKHLDHCSINNSVVLTTSLALSRSNESALEPRVIVSNNDNTIKFFDVPLRTTGSKHTRDLREVGLLKFSVPINHTSLSPDARTVLSVGDSSEVYLRHLSGGSRLTSTPIATLALPKPQGLPFWLPSNALAASFSTAFSADGAKFAVASQEGVVAVWDVRSTKPMKVFQTDKTTGLGPASFAGGGLWAGGAAAAGWSNSAASGWLFEDAYFRPGSSGAVRAPGWSVRNVKFGGGVGGTGKEVMVFTEHSNVLHVVDAKTFELEETICVPSARGTAMSPVQLIRPTSAAATGNNTTTTTTRPSSVRTLSETNLGAAPARSRSSSSPGVDYVYSQLPGFARRAAAASRFPGPLTFSTQRDRDLRDVQDRRLQRARDILLARRTARGEDDNNNNNNESTRTRTGYSPPSAIGDSTLRTLRTAGEDGGLGRSRSMLNTLNRLLRPGESAADWSSDREGDDEEAALLLIPALVDGIEARDVEDILDRHGVSLSPRNSATRTRIRDRRGGEENMDEEREDGDGDGVGRDDEDRNTGSAVADFEYPYEFGDPSVWSDAARDRERERRLLVDDEGGGGGEEDMDIDEGEATFTRRAAAAASGSGSGRGRSRGGFNWITGREEDDVDERDQQEREVDDRDRDRGGEGKEDPGNLDIAGVCFDPSGGRVYVATTKSVVEWNVRGAEKRWWSGDEWA